MRHTILLPIAVLLAAAPAAAAPLGVERFVDLAVKNDTSLLSAEQDIIISRQRLREARSLLLPQISFSGSLSRLSLEYPMVTPPELGGRFLDGAYGDNTYALRAHVVQPVYTGGRNRNAARMARNAWSQSRLLLETERLAAARKAREAFCGALYRRELLSAASSYHLRSLALAGRAAGGWDALEAGAAEDWFSRERDRAAHAYAASLASMSALIRNENGVLEIDGELAAEPPSGTLQKTIIAAMERRPELRGEIYRAQMDEIALNMAALRRYPNVYIGAVYDMVAYDADSFSSMERTGSWAASVAIHFPLSYDWWTQIVQRRAQQRQGSLKRVELEESLRGELRSAWDEASFRLREAEEARAALAAAAAGYDRARRSAPAEAGRAAAGLRTLYDKELALLESLYLQKMAAIRLAWAQGKGLPE
ncbi:MAG: TolC family protein [Elusimicrobiales bacterium]|jgi:outer membrane protein TolC|nr:TolC family protein [Elusimicrobiales bacterium]